MARGIGFPQEQIFLAVIPAKAGMTARRDRALERINISTRQSKLHG
jgi:hypothetical protein